MKNTIIAALTAIIAYQAGLVDMPLWQLVVCVGCCAYGVWAIKMTHG